MNSYGEFQQSPRVVRSLVLRAGGYFIRALRQVLFLLFALLERVVMGILAVVALALALVALFCGLLSLAHPWHFPFGVVLLCIAGCGVVAVVYQAIMQLLDPGVGRHASR